VNTSETDRMETDDTEKELESAAILEDPEVKELAKKKDEEKPPIEQVTTQTDS